MKKYIIGAIFGAVTAGIIYSIFNKEKTPSIEDQPNIPVDNITDNDWVPAMKAKRNRNEETTTDNSEEKSYTTISDVYEDENAESL